MSNQQLFDKTLEAHKKNKDVMIVHTINGVRLTGMILDYSWDQKIIILGDEFNQTIINFDNVTSYTARDNGDSPDRELARYHRQRNVL
jgi:sRNA-binding regulator protein Hfq